MFNNILNAPEQGKDCHDDLSCALQLKTEPYWHLEKEMLVIQNLCSRSFTLINAMPLPQMVFHACFVLKDSTT